MRWSAGAGPLSKGSPEASNNGRDWLGGFEGSLSSREAGGRETATAQADDLFESQQALRHFEVAVPNYTRRIESQAGEQQAAGEPQRVEGEEPEAS